VISDLIVGVFVLLRTDGGKELLEVPFLVRMAEVGADRNILPRCQGSARIGGIHQHDVR
jgi:hypothetical protein